MKSFILSILLCLALVAAASAEKLPDLFTYWRSNKFNPAELHPGDTLSLKWRVENNSTMCIPEIQCEEVFGPAYGPWQEAVLLSKDATPDAEDILLGTVMFNGVLQPGGSHEVNTQFEVPSDCPPGIYRIIVYADYVAGQPEGQLEEVKETNNWDDCREALNVINPLLLLAPNGGELLAAGSTYTIRWEDDRDEGKCSGGYLLDYSTDGGKTWMPVDSNYVSNTCSYDWVVPNVNSEMCLMRVTGADDSSINDTSDATFTIYKGTLIAGLRNDYVVGLYDFATIGRRLAGLWKSVRPQLCMVDNR